MFKVIKFFTDLQDNDFPYEVGDPFPRKGLEVTEERLTELLGCDNLQKQPLIEKAAEPAKKPAKKAAKKAAE